MENSNSGFVIMQIGDKELDRVYNEVYYPALKESNLMPCRIDKDNKGYILKKEITDNIENSPIIIADITNERPNCYLEIGYAMGLDKYKNLIITSREDHHPDSPNYNKKGPKIHFDLSGYDILFWHPDKLPEFKEKLIEKISRRIVAINPNTNTNQTPQPIWDEVWIKKQRVYAIEKLKEIEAKCYMEISISPELNDININQSELLTIAASSQIRAFGWSIAIIFIDAPQENKPIPKPDGVISEVLNEGNIYFPGKSYDYSYFRKDGKIFIIKDIYENRAYPNCINPGTRIIRTTEILLYISRYYSKLGLNSAIPININIKYFGLKGRKIWWPGYYGSEKVSQEDTCESQIRVSLNDIENKLPELVNELLSQLFILFDFYVYPLDSIRHQANNFVESVKKKG